LVHDADMECKLPTSTLTVASFRPIRDVAEEVGLGSDAELHSLELVYKRTEAGAMVFGVLQTRGPLAPDPRVLRRARREGAFGEDGGGEDGEHEAMSDAEDAAVNMKPP